MGAEEEPSTKKEAVEPAVETGDSETFDIAKALNDYEPTMWCEEARRRHKHVTVMMDWTDTTDKAVVLSVQASYTAPVDFTEANRPEHYTAAAALLEKRLRAFGLWNARTEKEMNDWLKPWLKATVPAPEPKVTVEEGKIFDNNLLVHKRVHQAPYDRSYVWLVENLKTGKAELWRACDLTGIKRKGKRYSNPLRHSGYGAFSSKFNGFDKMIAEAQQALADIKAGTFDLDKFQEKMEQIWGDEMATAPVPPAAPAKSNRELKRQAFKILHPEFSQADNKTVDKAIHEQMNGKGKQ